MARAQRVQVHVDPALSESAEPGPAPSGAAVDTALAVLGLRAGETVRWRHLGGRGWQSGVATRRERDGSVRITDDRGLARSLTVDRLEVRHTGPRGARGWEPLSSRAARSEQLRLL